MFFVLIHAEDISSIFSPILQKRFVQPQDHKLNIFPQMKKEISTVPIAITNDLEWFKESLYVLMEEI